MATSVKGAAQLDIHAFVKFFDDLLQIVGSGLQVF